MMASDLVLLSSGTAALEAMLAKRPMVVAYRIAHLTYWVVKALGLLKVTRYSLPNALAGRQLVPELMQYDLTPESLANKALSMLCGDYQQAELQAEFLRLHQELKRDASSLAAAAVLALVSKTHDAQS
jgi:lipid-A-disaccharide synthase